MSSSDSTSSSPILHGAANDLMAPSWDARHPGSRGHSDSDLTRGGDPPSRASGEAQTWSEFLRTGHEVAVSGSQHSHDSIARRNTIMAMDRKRRLTVEDDSARRRSINEVGDSQGASSSRTHVGRPLPPRRPSWRPHDSVRSDTSRASDEGVSDPMNPLSRRTSSGGRRGSAMRDYVLPRWQPDSEVSHCPICGTQFTFWYRKHHCRKCGRVVCASCSPHRITIPRQFIVHLPDPNKPATTSSATNRSSTNANVVDLTGEEDEQQAGEANMSVQTQQSRDDLPPELGGGEEVRLCNPCVPDPNPDPPRNYANDRIFRWTNGIALDEQLNPIGPRNPGLAEYYGAGRPRGWDSPHHRPHYSMPSYGIPPSEARGQRSRGMMFPPEGRETGTDRIGGQDFPEEGLLGYGDFNYPGYRGVLPSYISASSVANPQHPMFSPSNYTMAGASSSSAPRPGAGIPGMDFPGRPRGQSAAAAHSRMQSADTDLRDDAARARMDRHIRSMLGVGSAYHSQSPRPPPTGPRPRLHERDICPICRRALPPRGPDGNEEAREAHIMDCISQRDPTSANHTPQPPHAYMLPFIATEKDCVGEDGSPQECTICMVDYDVGDELARLECLCKFHKSCIVEWFERKRECPVHRASQQGFE